MPPTPQQGSRAGLISALVVFVILFVTTTILWIYQSAETRKAQDQANLDRARYTPFISEAALADQKVRDLEAVGKEGTGPYAGMSAIEVAIAQRDAVAKAITGAPSDTAAALGQSQAALSAATKQQTLVAVPQGAGLAPVIGTLAATIATQVGEKAGLQEQLVAAQKASDDVLASQKALLEQRDAQIAELSQKYAAAEEEIKTYRGSVDTNVATIEKGAQSEIKRAQNAAAKATAALAAAQAEKSNIQKQLDQARGKLVTYRVNVKEPIVQVADGRIARLPGNNTAYIDLGGGDGISPGMTFEVYDKYAGIPALGQDGLRESDMPVGKASLEVMRVSAGSSECRIIRKTAGQEPVEGDYIANLVFDPKTKYNFVVYGDFDLDHNGVAATQDAEVVKRLITQWGGKVQTAINADTDFLIMGKEPVLPELSDDEKADPVRIKQVEEITAALNAYQDVLSKASLYHIPVMNQNRFLYFSGYYSQAPR